MNPCIDYKDTIQLIDPLVDSYGSEKIGQVETVNCLFISRTGANHVANQAGITSDAELYIDPNHWFVSQNWNRLEEMLIIASEFGSPADESWYKITNINIGQDKLLCNNIDNILLQLKKTVKINYVS